MQGAMTALITPFKNGKVDEETYAKLIQRQIDNGIDWVVPVGTTGESATLTHDEHKRCIEIAVEVCKGTDTKVLAGAGSNSTHEAIDLAKFAEEKGADAILSVSPYYNKPTQRGLYEHYKALANSIEIPVVLYNVPGRTCSNIEVDTAIRLFNEVENIVAIKEATGKIENVVALCSKSGISVISGDDAINYPIIASGGKGVISVTSNLLPKKIADLVHSALKGEFIESKKINEELYELNKILFVESNPIPIKYAMYEAGLLPSLEYRLPLVEPSEENKEKIKKVLKKYL
ncbi:4-hydroxy-tetrahydrodipicolinate synthase [Caminibacter pacificus]|uniref:4-hydroxy-tetrahydrodipicolinate synthase n=1 Tax=Caminibacter pacificus TaxID=1424653 RepID=A0AAJ4RE39_9BACT|nr:4-hydroxy-tetrahydrodipicolinate synthase [Caminibacter pacificus]NPA87187.1 4-hydroxy-tetrahydrodipicolinate synthase [Campylobacterota bacterium]QCI28373.1 4-hydroxy-tetrahydrodipicolinate synthase [Caminibacter pacificus]ROR40904.1 dihydrodipicolinate synthase [Caminibacter pacificus]